MEIDILTIFWSILIFLLRIVDVSLGTLRTISVVRGRWKSSIVYGFIEVLVWSTAVTQVFAGDAPATVLLGYAAGYAAGNAVGIWLEQRFARRQVVYIIYSDKKDEILKELENHDWCPKKKKTNDAIHIFGCRTITGRLLNTVKNIDKDCQIILSDVLYE